MATHTPTPIVHVYTEVNVGKYRKTKHYELEAVKHGAPQLSTLINISKDQGCARSSPPYWIKTREGKKWQKPMTGLFKVPVKGMIYYGDDCNKKHLVITDFEKGARKVTVYYFKNFYTANLNNVIQIINRLS